MRVALSLVVGLALGGVVGVAYFAALWLTVRRVVVSAHPRRLMRRSRVLRLVGLLAVMAVVIRVDAAMFLAMVPGVLLGRSLVSRRVVHGPSREVANAS